MDEETILARIAHLVEFRTRRFRITAGLGLVAGAVVSAWPATAAAQNIPLYFPSGVGGFDQGIGVTVLSRLRPLYETSGIHADGFVINPALDQSLFYNSNVTGTAGSGSWGERTSASVSATSDWERNRLGGTIGVSNNQFLALPNDAYTDWNVGIGGGYTINDSLLEAAYSHQLYHQVGVVIGATTSQTPVRDQTDTAHSDYTFNFGPYSITPDVSVSDYRYGTATVQGVQQIRIISIATWLPVASPPATRGATKAACCSSCAVSIPPTPPRSSGSRATTRTVLKCWLALTIRARACGATASWLVWRRAASRRRNTPRASRRWWRPVRSGRPPGSRR